MSSFKHDRAAAGRWLLEHPTAGLVVTALATIVGHLVSPGSLVP